MLTTICPNCNEAVNSELLAEISTIECVQCSENFPVKDIIINTPHFTINRSDFFGQIRRYKRLLGEAEKEKQLLANDKGATTNRIADLDNFLSSLHELLDGARDNYRMDLPSNFYLEVSCQNSILRGKLLNLSAEGCSIELLMLDVIPPKNSEIRIEFYFPDSSGTLSTRARVVWTNRLQRNNGINCAIIGVSFVDIGEATRQCIWDYIISNAPIPFQRVSR